MLNKIKIYLERQIRISSLTFFFFDFWNRKLRKFWKLIWIRKWNSEFKLRVTHSLDFPLKLSCHLQNTFSLLQAPHFNCFPNYFVMVLYKRTTFIFFFYCSGFCHTLTWISHGFTCVPHPDPPSHLPLHPIPLGLPSAPGPSTCLMHPTWASDLFHPR